MICGCGTDIVEIERMRPWLNMSDERLRTFFACSEINELRSLQENEERAMAFLASRFAAKEAFYKALSGAMVATVGTPLSIGLRAVASRVAVKKIGDVVPILKVDWAALVRELSLTPPFFMTHLSLSHEKTFALAYVILEQ
jgi:holo-[acyl-carrier protein] synthase